MGLTRIKVRKNIYVFHFHISYSVNKGEHGINCGTYRTILYSGGCGVTRGDLNIKAKSSYGYMLKASLKPLEHRFYQYKYFLYRSRKAVFLFKLIKSLFGLFFRLFIIIGIGLRLFNILFRLNLICLNSGYFKLYKKVAVIFYMNAYGNKKQKDDKRQNRKDKN